MKNAHMEYYKKAKELMDMDAVEFVGGVSERYFHLSEYQQDE